MKDTNREELLRYLLVLELEPGASFQDIKSAYRELCLIWHPDKNPARVTARATRKLQHINEAYDWLSKHSYLLDTVIDDYATDYSRNHQKTQYKASKKTDSKKDDNSNQKYNAYHENEHILLGGWKRVGDRYAGAIVEVQKVGERCFAIIIETAGLKELDFQKGELKWKEITQTDHNTWEGKDIGKAKNIIFEKLMGKVREFPMVLILDDPILTMKTGSSTQIWHRILRKA